MTGITDGTWTSTFTYTDDGRGLQTSETFVGISGFGLSEVDWTLDPTGAITGTSVSLNQQTAAVTNTYAYDSTNHRVTAIAQAGAFASPERVEFTYANNLFQIAKTDRFNSLSGGTSIVSTVITFDARNYVATLTHQGSGQSAPINSYAYQYDKNGFVTQRQDNEGTATYGYDKGSQEVSVSYGPSLPGESYTYDAAGNPTASSRQGAVAVGNDNQISDDSTASYQYDAEGNLTRSVAKSDGSSQEFQWDFRNRLVQVRFLDGQGQLQRTANYQYDALNRRVSSTVVDKGVSAGQALVTYFIYDRGNIILELADTDGVAGLLKAAPSRAYLHGLGADQVLAQDDGGGSVLWLLADAKSNIRDTADNTGKLTDHFLMDSFGNIVGRSPLSLPTRYLFAGREFDSVTGLYYNRARYYDPQAGRFISADPTGFGSGDANFYRYANNNGANFRDPSGLAFVGAPAGPQFINATAAGNAALVGYGFYGYFGGGLIGNTFGLANGVVNGVQNLASGIYDLAIRGSLDAINYARYGISYQPISQIGKLISGIADSSTNEWDFAGKAVSTLLYGFFAAPFVQTWEALKGGDSVALGEGIFNLALLLLPVVKGLPGGVRALGAARDAYLSKGFAGLSTRVTAGLGEFVGNILKPTRDELYLTEKGVPARRQGIITQQIAQFNKIGKGFRILRRLERNCFPKRSPSKHSRPALRTGKLR